MANIKLKLEFTSMFKGTALYTKAGKTFFGVWQKPNIILDGDEKAVTINTAMVGNLDLLAHQELGDRSLFWAIAIVNGIKNPPEEVVVGREIIIPKIENVNAALLEQGNA